MKQKVFAYGTLMGGFGNSASKRAEIMGGEVKLLGGAVIEGSMYSLGGFPCVSLEGSGSVLGEVYEVCDSIFRWMDILEGYPNFYDRKQVDTPYGKAWVYFIEDQSYHQQPVESGSWREHVGAK